MIGGGGRVRNAVFADERDAMTRSRYNRRSETGRLTLLRD